MKPTEERQFEGLFRSITIELKRRADQRVMERGMNSQQGRMIAYIASQEEKGLIQKDLEKVFQRRGASITSMLQGLEKKGFIERRTTPEDERQKRLYVLPKGKELVEEFNRLFAELETLITGDLSPEEQEELYRLLRKVEKSVRETRLADES